MHFLNNKEQLFALLAQGTTVVTPNNRLSESILRQYFTYCNDTTVDKPFCLPYGVALIKAYERLNSLTPLNTHPILLNKTQCQHLWRKIIKDEPYITYSESLLNAIITTWEHCHQWQIHPEDPTFNYTPQTRQFQKWWQFFDTQLHQLQLIAETQLVPYLIHENSFLFSQPVVWVCFDDFSPQQQRLQQHLNDQGFQQYHYDLKEQDTTTQIFAARDDKEECQQLIAWLHAHVQQGKQRIGVVVPDLQQKSRSLQRELARHFDSSLYNLSLGQPLSEFSLVAHALCWLHLDAHSLNHHEITLLLQSPYLGYAKEEFIARSEYQQESALLEVQSCSLKTLIQDLESYAPKLASLLTQITPYPSQATPQEWIDLFHKRLHALNFPGDYGLNSENYQCFNRFTALFDELRQLSVLCTSLSKSEALEILGKLAENTIFQAQKINASIQISGLLEASGCEFDCVWVMGLTDQCLPQKVRLSAFIPPQLQRELVMPHSLPERELQFARQIIQRLQRGAHSAVFSYAQLQGDNPNLPCSLITHLPPFELLPIHSAAIPHNDLIVMEEHYNVPIKTDEQISGGTALLANQAKCPFKAFAEHRLRAKPSSQVADGLDPRERGQIIHKVMELLWHTLGSQQKLLDTDTKTLEQYIDEAIHSALIPLQKSHPDSIQEVEYIRLKRLVIACLEWEKQRTPFTIAALEQSYSINLSGLDFQVRVDRLDQVSDKKWVIDYKSSLPASKPWNEDRPQEPQLLLYALLDEQINTLLLMQLKTGKISCSGISEEKQDISGITIPKKEETWTTYRENWRHQLTNLANEFQQGHCPPEPTQASICQQCDFQNLCRFQTAQ